MPNIGIDAHVRNINNLLTAAGQNRAARQQAITIYLQANVDQFTGNPQLINGVINRLPNAAGLIRQAANRLLPPPQLPPGITIADINARRIFHGGNRSDNVDRMWANFTNAMRGRVFNVNQLTAGLVAGWLAQERLDNGRPASEGTPAQRGVALARAGWRDNFFSSMELAAVFQYSQTLNENDRTQFQQAFVQEFTGEVQRKFPGQQQYIMMQFTRFINNTNWDSNDPITQGFRTFMNSLMAGQAEASLTPEQKTQLQNNPGTMVVLATYDIPDERGNFGAACLVGSYERQPDGTLRFQTRVISHRPGLLQNRWRLNFGQVQQPVQPNQQPAPGFGNLLEWIQQWLQQLQQVPPLQPPPGGGGVGGPQQPPPPEGVQLPPIPGNRAADVHIELNTQHTKLQATIQAIKQRDHGGVDISNDLRELEEISNQLSTLIRQGTPNEAEQIRQISNRLNQFHNRISSQDSGILNNFTGEILGVSTSLNQTAGRIVRNNFHENTGNVKNNLDTALQELTNLFEGAISQAQRQRGEAIRVRLQELARPDRPIRPDDVNRLRELANDITTYVRDLNTNPNRNPHLDTMRDQSRRLREIADSLEGT